MNSQSFRQIITQQSEILTFGKYRHKTVQHVLRTDPNYIIWLAENKIVKFPQDVVDDANARLDDEMWSDPYAGNYEPY